MNTSRRLFAVSLLSMSAVMASGTANAWSFNWGSGERIRGDGEVTTEQREPGSYDAISLAGDFKLVVRQGGNGKLEIKADKNVLPYLETKVVESAKGRTLEIATRRGYYISSSTTPQISIDMGALRGLSIAGSGSAKVEAMQTSELKASIAGSGDINFVDLKAERVGFSVSGSGDIVASGNAANLNVSVAGSGDIKAKGLVVDDAKVRIAGSGDVVVQASKKLDISIAGSGDVSYLGNPELHMSTAGSGRVHKLNN
ncbi:head GIN domain-containing protein [Paucibacter sp. APW11]|uniref:Head GIN domain-containing protein n=1 Tax=Roseateles aquae TaxID=3077235 RepID=A0ABU3PB72_9BURK|nr:head GIN domain-containing protein [Paucibacter sp. APW11]MDT8999819.1 head GIN domain-containing protein [Paucibacter sp. APW11]